MDPIRCPNKVNHVSGTPAFDRTLCPFGCGIYVRKGGPVVEVQDRRVFQENLPPARPSTADVGKYVRDLVARAKRDFLGMTDQEQVLVHDMASATWDLARVQANEAGGQGEATRYLVTINADKYWTIRLARDSGGGWLARDKDLAAALRAAADKLEADARKAAV